MKSELIEIMEELNSKPQTVESLRDLLFDLVNIVDDQEREIKELKKSHRLIKDEVNAERTLMHAQTGLK